MTEPGVSASSARPSLLRRLLSGVGWALFGKILGVGSALVVNAILARLLAPADMGAYFMLVSITMFAAIVARFGFKQTIVRIVAQAMAEGLPGRAGQGLKKAFLIISVGAAIVAVLYATLLADWLGPVFDMPVLATVAGLGALWVVILTYQTPVAETFRGLHDIRFAVLFDGILSSVFLAVLLVVCWLAGVAVGFRTAILLTVAAAGTGLLIGTPLLAGRRARFVGPGDIGTAEILGMSAPLFVTNLATQAITSAPLWIAGALLGAADVALFGAAWKLVNLVSLPLLIMNMSVQPLIAELHTLNDRERLQTALRGSATLAGLPALAVLLVYIATSGTVLEVVYGAPYRDAAQILIVLSIGQLANVWAGSCGQVLVFTGHQRQLMNITLWTGFVSVALAVAGGHYFGLTGIAVAACLARVLQNGAMWWRVRRLTGYWTHATLTPAYLRAAWRRLRGRRAGKAAAG